MKFNSTLFAAALTLLAVAPMKAQVATPAPETTHTRFAATNPIGLVLGVIGAEYEQKFQENTTIGGSISTFTIGEVTLFSVSAAYRYFLNDVAMEGFSVASTAGFMGGTAKTECFGYESHGCEETRESVVFPTVGVELAYTFRLGKADRFIIQPTIGAKRLITTALDEDMPFSFALPTGGISVGYAF